MGLREQLTNMSPREQKLLSVLGIIFGLMIFLGAPAYIYVGLAESRGQNEDMRKALRDMNRAGELLAKRKGERNANDLRYAKQLEGGLGAFIEGAASTYGLEVDESSERPDNKHKGYTERVTSVKMRKIGLKALVQMLEKIERSGHPVSISQLSIRARASAPDQYDVQFAVSAFEKQSAKPDKGDKKPKTTKPKKKGKETEL